MSNYDWYDDYDPYEQDKRDAPATHCGKVAEHEAHTYGTHYPRESGPRPNPSGLWRTYESTPFFKCPGTVARAERFKDMLIHFHDGGKVTWSRPEDLYLAELAVTQNREEAARVALSKEA